MTWADAGVPAEDRFWARVEKSDGCWNWTGHTTGHGYGRIIVDGKKMQAHVYSYVLHGGVVPKGWVVDHLCHNRDVSCLGGGACPHRRCMNPAHLEAVTNRSNLLRGHTIVARQSEQTRCKRDHPLSGDNLIVRRGKRECRKCKAILASNYRAKHRDRINRKKREGYHLRKAG